jgi:uncharacterized protein YndB with AHSA1/START domain
MAMSKYAIEATAIIDAPANVVFDYINDMNHFGQWSPFAQLDKSLTAEVGAINKGVGASYSYQGKMIGSGEMTFTKIETNELIEISMDFGAPNPSHADIEWRLVAEGTLTRFTWAMVGERNLKNRIMAKVFNLNKVMTKHFADGLNNVKAHVEKTK